MKEVALPKEISAAMLHQTGSAFRILRLFIISKQMTMVQIIDTAGYSFNNGYMMLGMLCFRALIEQISHFRSVLCRVQSYSVPTKFDEANKVIFEINGFLVSRVYGTRVDWNNLLVGKSEELLQKNKVKYKQEDHRINRTAESILDAVDGLTKKIKGVRAVYEVLSEFAHPNVGPIIALTKSAHPVIDKHGFNWIEKEFSIGPPLTVVSNSRDCLNEIFKVLAKCVIHFEELVFLAGQESEKIQQISQVVLRYILARRRNLLELYSPCPCESGLKVKFCCGATM